MDRRRLKGRIAICQKETTTSCKSTRDFIGGRTSISYADQCCARLTRVSCVRDWKLGREKEVSEIATRRTVHK